MKAIVLTSTLRRHVFVANTLAERLNVVGVWQERKSFEPLRYAGNADDEAVIARHFDARQASEDAFFESHDVVRNVPAVQLEPGGCNRPEAIDAMRALGPDVVLVFGTGLLKPVLLDQFPGRAVNIHLGLSPYYRGAGTNFWPLVNGEPEYCGATIHMLDDGVDTGPVITHVRPGIAAADGPHDIGNKTIVAAAGALAGAAEALLRGRVNPVPQSPGGRVYRRADFSADAVRRLYDNFARGMVAEYLAHRHQRDAALSLVSMGAAA